MTLEDAQHRMRSRNLFGATMVAAGDADGLVSGLSGEYSDTIRPALAGDRHPAGHDAGSAAATS